MHGHGSKGGLLARATRLAARSPSAIRAYTPHGGSFNYRPGTAAHRLYMGVERALAPLTDVFLFESAYVAERFAAAAGGAPAFGRVVVNGLGPSDFERAAPDSDATEFLYVGELRAAKGLDTLIEALARIGAPSRPAPRLTLVGSGPEEARLAALAQEFGVADRIRLPGPMPFRAAVKLGRVLVVPSRVESLPYVVLEAAAAGVPIVATDVGGIREIFGPFRDRLGPADDPADLSRRMAAVLEEEACTRNAETGALRAYVADRFTIAAMTDGVLAAYREALSRRLAPRASGEGGAGRRRMSEVSTHQFAQGRAPHVRGRAAASTSCRGSNTRRRKRLTPQSC